MLTTTRFHVDSRISRLAGVSRPSYSSKLDFTSTQRGQLHYLPTGSSSSKASQRPASSGCSEGHGQVVTLAASAFVDSLAILPVGHKVGQWPLRLLATPGHELVTRIAAVADTDLHDKPLSDAQPPAWHKELNHESARFFWSHPTLEPSLVSGNKTLIKDAFTECNLKAPDPVTTETVDQYFDRNPANKGRFALALALLIDQNLRSVTVPNHISDAFAWLYDGSEPSSTPIDDVV